MATRRTIEVKCKTKLSKDDTSPVETVLTIELDDDSAVDKFAGRCAAIAWQSIARAAGVIPNVDSVKISELAKRTGGGGFKATPTSIAARTTKMSEVDYRATLVALGVSGKELDRMVAKHSASITPPTVVGTPRELPAVPAPKAPAKKK